MSALLAVLFAVSIYGGAADVPYIPHSGDVLAIGDNQFVVVTLGEWDSFTNKVAALQAVAERRWANEHKTKEGRKAWHGDIVRTEIVGLEQITTYADGFTWTEKMVKKAANPPPTRSAERQTNKIPPRLQAKREAAKARKTRTVNAVFSAGGKVEEVKE